VAKIPFLPDLLDVPVTLKRTLGIESPVSEQIAELIVAVAGAYVVAGALFAVVFAAWGVSRVDPVARNCTRGFRLIILPGATVLWPLLAARWMRSNQ
jgi:hypothetical protein